MSETNKTTEYWAASDVATCAAAVEEKIDAYYKFLQQNGYLSLWLKSYKYHFGGKVRMGRINQTGDEGEYSIVNVNHFRNLLLHILQLAVGQRPAFEPRAINSDVKSQKQTILARGLLDYYMREKRLERALKRAAEYTLCFGEGYVTGLWNATAGKPIATDPDTNIEIREGDLEFNAVEPIDVVRDPMLESYRNRDWVIVRTYPNKFELMSKYPEYADQIAAMEPHINARHHYRTLSLGETFDSDKVVLYTLYHTRNDSCPDGRQMELLDGTLVLTDGPLAYRHLPVHRMAANEVFGTPFGYTVAYDLAALQENYDMLWSTITTNQAMFGVQNVLVPKGAGFNVVDMPGQLKFVEYDSDMPKPEPMNLLSTPAEVFSHLGTIEAQMMTISGVNSVSRGDPQASLKSGAALALVQSMSIQFNQQLQEAYVELLEDVGTATIELLQDYAEVPRVAAIAGQYNRSYVEEFSSKDISNIDRVIVDAGNPLMQTVAGKMELAQTMLQAGFIKMPDELLSVMNTGNLMPLIQGKSTELLQLAQENEELKQGRPVQVVITDDHALHIMEHKSVLADPEARKTPEIQQAALTHLQDHIDMLKSPGYQELLQLMGQPALGAPPQPGQPPAGAPGPNGAMPTMPENNANAQVAAMQPQQPTMPKNAMTGQTFNTTTGGL
jgi:hypothetical protein